MSPASSKQQAPGRELPLRVTVRLTVLDPDDARELRDRQLAAILRLLRRAATGGTGATASRNEPDRCGGGAR